MCDQYAVGIIHTATSTMRSNGKDIQRINCIRFNPKWTIPLRLMVDAVVRKLYYADFIMLTHF